MSGEKEELKQHPDGALGWRELILRVVMLGTGAVVFGAVAVEYQAHQKQAEVRRIVGELASPTETYVVVVRKKN